MTELAIRKQFPGLDIVRFLAALSVVAFHLTFRISEPTGTALLAGAVGVPFPELAQATWAGWVGVEIFFVLSGIVIAFTAEQSSPFAFLRSRFLRLYPAAWISTALAAAALLAVGVDTSDLPTRVWRSLILFPVEPWIDGAFWTLPIEVSFYGLVFALLLIGRVKWLERLGYALIAASAIFWSMKFAHRMDESIANIPQSTWTRITLLEHGGYFGLGIILWRSAAGGITGPRIAFALVAIVVGFAEIVGVQGGVFFAPVGVWLVALAAMAASLFVPALQFRSLLARRLGLITYPLYLTHQTFGYLTIGTLIRMGANRFLALATAVTICFCVAIAIALIAEPRVKAFLASLFARLHRPLPVNVADLDHVPAVSRMDVTR